MIHGLVFAAEKIGLAMMGGGLAVTFGRVLGIIQETPETSYYSWWLTLGGIALFAVYAVAKSRELRELGARLEHIQTMLDETERAARGRKGTCGLHGDYEGSCRKCSQMMRHGICPMHGKFGDGGCRECLENTKRSMSKYPRRDREEGD